MSFLKCLATLPVYFAAQADFTRLKKIVTDTNGVKMINRFMREHDPDRPLPLDENVLGLAGTIYGVEIWIE